ncbi:hypothetical protein [Synechococcus sp. RS9916]|uniref:hypothetical protein n=1 Tax=Synechococcus sp. RS9916 TaxID=221359 RepID=UPI0000E53DB0|nr:hypothetical protein [Synechococcus sp. RS9916]EAU73036.1 hypothetical protein RS9916_26034 [Synechococcus sp. RS9916]
MSVSANTAAANDQGLKSAMAMAVVLAAAPMIAVLSLGGMTAGSSDSDAVSCGDAASVKACPQSSGVALIPAEGLLDLHRLNFTSGLLGKAQAF